MCAAASDLSAEKTIEPNVLYEFNLQPLEIKRLKVANLHGKVGPVYFSSDQEADMKSAIR